MQTKGSMAGRVLPWNVVAVLAVFVCLAVAYAVVSPPFENPDEMSHAEYAAFLAVERRLPVLETDCVRMAFHPPLYHALLAPIAVAMGIDAEAVMAGHHVNPEYASTHVVLMHGFPDETFPFAGVSRFVVFGRLVSIVFGLVTLIYVYRIARLIGDAPAFHFLSVATVAAIPQFQYLAASLNHDALAAAAATAMLFYAIQLLERATVVEALKCGAALGVGLLAKSSLVPLAVVPLFALVMRRQPWRERLQCFGTLYGATLVIAGWWYARNVARYGSMVPIVHLHQTTWIGTNLVREAEINFGYVRGVIRTLFESFWFLAGLMNVAGPSWMYWFWGLTTLVAAVGMALLAQSRNGRLLVLSWLIVLAGVLQYNMYLYSAQGRYLFIVVSVFGMGVARVVVQLSGSRTTEVASIVGMTLAAIAIECFRGSFAPTYASLGHRTRPTELETARLCCGGEYGQEILPPGGRLTGVVVASRRSGSGSFELELSVRRGAEGEVVRHATVSSSALDAETKEVVVALEPLVTTPGETLVVALRAPEATPIAKPAVPYRVDPAESRFSINGHVRMGRLLVRGLYE